MVIFGMIYTEWMNTHESLQWRYATKKFNEEKVSEDDLNYILEAGNMAATSYGLQPISFVVVSDHETKEKLLPHAYNQMQVTSCSDLVVLCASTKIDEVMISEYMQRIATTREMDVEKLNDFKEVLISDLTNRPQDVRTEWAKKQAYIALGSMMIAAGERKVDGCPMEGFDNAKFDEVLGLGDHSLTSAVIFPVGFRSEKDQSQEYKKVRRDLEDIVVRK